MGDDHTGIDFECLDDSTSTVIFWIAIPVLSVKHNHVFTHGTGDILNALDGTSSNEQWAGCIMVAIVGEDGAGVAIVGGVRNKGGEEGDGRIIIAVHCFLTVPVLAGALGVI